MTVAVYYWLSCISKKKTIFESPSAPRKRICRRLYHRYFLNLDVKFTQIAKSYHILIQSITNRYNLINDFLKQICTHIEIMRNELQEGTSKHEIQLSKLMGLQLFPIILLLVTKEK